MREDENKTFEKNPYIFLEKVNEGDKKILHHFPEKSIRIQNKKIEPNFDIHEGNEKRQTK